MRAAPVFCLFAMSACANPVPSPPDDAGAAPPPVATDGCGAAALGPLVGQDVAAFTAQAWEGPARIVRPGQPVTMDFNPGRLNVLLDAGGRIAGFSCG